MYTVYYLPITGQEDSLDEIPGRIFISGVPDAKLAMRIAYNLMDDFGDRVAKAWAAKD